MRVFRQTRALWVVTAAVLLFWAACGSSRTCSSNGRSTTTVTASQRIHFKAKGPMTFPPSYPVIGGKVLEEGVEIDVTLEPGQSINLTDRVSTEGRITITGVERRAAPRTVGEPAPVEPGSIDFAAAVLPGSTYTWQIPELFGDAEAVVEVGGTLRALAAPGALVEDEHGSWSLDPAGLRSFGYQVAGPAALWQAPFDTPYGRIEGSGTIETTTPMVLEFSGDLAAISAAAAGEPGPNGWAYVGSYPVRLLVGEGVATGATVVDGDCVCVETAEGTF